MEIPQKIEKAAKERIELGGRIQFLCEYEGEQIYICKFEEQMIIGLPELYLWNGIRAKTVDGREALTLLSKLPI